MGAFSKRYLVWFALILLAFLAFSLLEIAIYLVVPFVVIAIFLGFACKKIKRRSKNFNLIIALLICAALLGCLRGWITLKVNYSKLEKYSGEHNVAGYVYEIVNKNDYFSEHILRVEELDGKHASFDLIVVCNYRTELERGDFLSMNVEISALAEDARSEFIKSNNIYDYPLVADFDEETEIEYLESEWRLPLMLSQLNSRLSSSLKAHLGTKTGSLASALLLGNREMLSDSTLRDFKRAGVYHMLALSGMHVAILVGMLELLLKKFRVPVPARVIVLASLSLFYIALTGFLLSACRAMIMLFVMYLSMLLSQKRDALTSLFVAISVICLISPSAILDVGLLLSFLSTFGVIAAFMIRSKLKFFNKSVSGGVLKLRAIKILRAFMLMNLTSLCVFISTLPIISICFGEVSLATFFSNLFMGFVCEAFMVLSLIMLLLSSTPLVSVAAYMATLVGNVMTRIVESIADTRGIMLSLEYPFTDALCIILFLLSLLLFAARLSRKWLLGVPCVAFALIFSINAISFDHSRRDVVSAEFLLGDKLLLSSSGGAYICDASNGSYSGFYESVRAVKENCFTEIDGIVLTHYHSAHAVSLSRLAKNFVIRSVLLPMPADNDEGIIMRSIVRVLEDEGVEVYIYEPERAISLLGGELCVSNRAYSSGYAHPSVALSYRFGEDRITLLERPFFGTYLEELGTFEGFIADSDYLIYGSDGRELKEDFELFGYLLPGCEVSFTDFDSFERSDYEAYLDLMKIYFDVEYKKYELK